MKRELGVEGFVKQSKTASLAGLLGDLLEDGLDSLVGHISHVLATACVFHAQSWRMLRGSFV